MKYCSNCGAVLEDDAQFCSECGTKNSTSENTNGSAWSDDAKNFVNASYDANSSSRSRLAAALLAWFLGVFGIHRFYVGKTGSGIAQLILTLSVIGALASVIWAFIDFIMILCGSFTDSKNKELKKW